MQHELCSGHLSIVDKTPGPTGVHYGQVLLYIQITSAFHRLLVTNKTADVDEFRKIYIYNSVGPCVCVCVFKLFRRLCTTPPRARHRTLRKQQWYTISTRAMSWSRRNFDIRSKSIFKSILKPNFTDSFDPFTLQ